jgi:hypothetical protein
VPWIYNCSKQFLEDIFMLNSYYYITEANSEKLTERHEWEKQTQFLVIGMQPVRLQYYIKPSFINKEK